MKKLGKFRMLTIASLSAVALAAPIALAQTTSTNQEKQSVHRGEGHGRGNGEGKRWGKRGHRGEGFGGMQRGLFRGVTLTDDQKVKLKQVSQSFRERTKSLRQQLRAKRQELRQGTDSGTFNESLAIQKLQESATLQAKLMSERFKMRQEMQSLLTAEQKAQIEQKRAEFKANRGSRGQRQVK